MSDTITTIPINPEKVDTKVEALNRLNFRGPLRYEIETSAQGLQAGKLFSLTIKITNPYDEPVTISSVNTAPPVELYDPSDRNSRTGTLANLKGIFDQEFEKALTARQHVAAISPSADRPGPVVLQPGNSIVRIFKLRTRQSMFFTPSTCSIHIEISYQMDGQENRDTARTTLTFKAPFIAIFIGAIIGAIAGTALRQLSDKKSPFDASQVLEYIASLLTAIVMIVAFGRKKDVQPFVSVEDFYGGMFIGFLSGYNGHNLLGYISSVGNTRTPEQ